MHNARRIRTVVFGTALGLALVGGATGPALASGGGGGGTSACVAGNAAKITSVTSTSGLGKYSVWRIKTNASFINCASAPAALTARITQTGEYYSIGLTSSFVFSCPLVVPAGGSATCTASPYAIQGNTYTVTVDILDATGTVIATNSAQVLAV